MRQTNNVTIIGHLTQEPTVHTFENGDRITNLSLANNRTYADASGKRRKAKAFIDVDAVGDVHAKTLGTGSRIAVTGRLVSRERERDGVTFNYVSIRATEIEYLDPPRAAATAVEER